MEAPSRSFSSSSASSSPFEPTADFSSLPILSLKEKIVEKILQNRVTLIVGETGCGKSSQVPQFLLESDVWPVLCTQPRRFAVVAVAKMVAMSRNCEVGEEVGYHIGHSKHFSESTKIMFKTAGVLLDEMRDKGAAALNYKAIILDEVHERSVESDLILVCIKQLLFKKNDLRVVLMSATADISTYRDYFGDLHRHERVEVLAIPASKQKSIFQRTVLYRDQITQMLGMSSDSNSRYCSGANQSKVPANMFPEVHILIQSLIEHIHIREKDIEKSILVFLPTYFDLEQQWHRLIKLDYSFKLHILHSSVDTEQALTAMKICKFHRKVILATNIAESSVTIPKVAYVIDSCRSLQILWDPILQKEIPNLVWVSKSQGRQREGRTGRTCDGTVYRLVTRSFFSEFKDYESPVIQKMSLRLQVLHICCAKSKAINNPTLLLKKTMDPPYDEIVEDALTHLTCLGALERTRNRYEPTFYGSLLASFSLSFDASVLVLKLGELGYLREGIILGVLMDTQPSPILHTFGDKEKHIVYACSYFGGCCNNSIGKKEMILVGNLCAYQFWQKVYKDNQRAGRLKGLLNDDEVVTCDTSDEREWCLSHNLIQSSLNHVAERYDEILCSLHRFRPDFFSMSSNVPYDYEHTCLLSDAEVNSEAEDSKCVAVPFVVYDHFDLLHIAKSFSDAISQVRAVRTDVAPRNQQSIMCSYFMSGSCREGSMCRFSHSPCSTRAPCRFFSTLQGCRNGERCAFSHDTVTPMPTYCEAELASPDAALFLRLFPDTSEDLVLILDDKDLRLSSILSLYMNPSRIVSTTAQTEIGVGLERVRVIRGVTRQHDPIMEAKSCVPWRRIKCVMWAPRLDSYSDDLERQKKLVQRYFDCLAARMVADAAGDVAVVVAMNNVKFGAVEVEKLARESFFYLKDSFPFDEVSFGVLSDYVESKKPMINSKAVNYVFGLHAPTVCGFAGDVARLFYGRTGVSDMF